MLSLWQRRLIVITLILLFVIMGPLLIFYAMGYRYNFAEHRIQRVGIIVVTHTPKDAITYVDKAQVAMIDTFAGTDRMRNLIPGDYEVAVKKEGYQPWQKKFNVKPEIATLARYVMLFKSIPESSDITTLDFKPEQITISSKQNKIAFISHKDKLPTIDILDLNSKTLKQHFPEKSDAEALKTINGYKIKSFSFNADASTAIVQLTSPKKPDLLYQLDATNTKVKALHSIASIAMLQSDSKNDNLFYYLKDKKLYSLNIRNQKTQELATNVKSYAIAHDAIYLAQEPEKSPYVNQAELNVVKSSFNGKNFTILATNLPLSESYSFAISEKGKIAISDKKNNLFYVGDDRLVHKISDNIKTFEWNEDTDKESSTGENLLFAQEYDIFTYDPAITNNEQITRFSEKIANVKWLTSDYKHIFFSVNDQIKVVETDENGGRITNDVFKATNSNPIFLTQDKESEIIYVLDKELVRAIKIR